MPFKISGFLLVIEGCLYENKASTTIRVPVFHLPLD